MEIIIRKKHLGANYFDDKNCPLAKASQEALNNPDIRAGYSALFDLNRDITHNLEGHYSSADLVEDIAKLRDNPDPEAIARTINTNPVT